MRLKQELGGKDDGYPEARFVKKNNVFYYTNSIKIYYFPPPAFPLLFL